MKQCMLILFSILFSLAVSAEGNWYYSDSETDLAETELKIYPNPCKNSKLTIDFGTKEIKEIRITNITGKQVLLKKYTMPTHKTQLQLNDIQNGIYLVQIKGADNKIVVKKLMVSKN